MSQPAESLPAFEHKSRAKYTESPNPAFTYGQKVSDTAEGKAWVEGAKDGWKTVDAATEDPGKIYPLMISGIVPRPVAFVSSVSADGVENLAPYSLFNQVTHNPPIISVSCNARPEPEGGMKDTVVNIKATKGFTVNIISEPWVENANMACIDVPADVGEWPLTGLLVERVLPRNVLSSSEHLVHTGARLAAL